MKRQVLHLPHPAAARTLGTAPARPQAAPAPASGACQHLERTLLLLPCPCSCRVRSAAAGGVQWTARGWHAARLVHVPPLHGWSGLRCGAGKAGGLAEVEDGVICGVPFKFPTALHPPLRLHILDPVLPRAVPGSTAPLDCVGARAGQGNCCEAREAHEGPAVACALATRPPWRMGPSLACKMRRCGKTSLRQCTWCGTTPAPFPPLWSRSCSSTGCTSRSLWATAQTHSRASSKAWLPSTSGVHGGSGLA